MKLKKLLKDIKGIEIRGPKEIEISGVCANSKYVAPGNLFIARRGKDHDGGDFIPEAIASGAKAVLTDLYDPAYKEIAQIVCHDVKKVEAELAAAYYELPSDKLYMVGITGTSGKTTVSYLVKHLLEKLDGPAGLMGTIEYQIGEMRYPATHTTPDVTRVHKLLKEMVDLKMRSCVMEVTSHALDQGRVEGVNFDTAVFTNLSPEHLDYHPDMEAYAKAKERLFHMLSQKQSKEKASFGKSAIINADSPWSSHMLERYRGQVLTYGVENHADVRAAGINYFPGKTEFKAVFRGISCPVFLPFSGKFNVYNFLAALSVGLSRGFSLESSVRVLENPPKIPGRLEYIDNKLGIVCLVDYAHKPDALENVLKTLSDIKTGKVITVFGCGGGGGGHKRPLMARAAEMYSDKVVVTTDNPRSEDPLAIIEAIKRGFSGKRPVAVEPDRKKAIAHAIEEAKEGDIVLIAGKGHEASQIFHNKTVPFDDRKEAKECLDLKESVRCR
ncbi:UDP-N-acetylmuramoyl-L-alanyl-D-glutamate--2,6-diaminopimelate ligase [Estrella lausannensis]|uniref:UDP-N-acetylmuramoyl-L-alanyl-D-glutamate--2,6-diaminopimelate ligase n=1 Tax=Estrella lausannensis TaxID=483423 RepID=A0A0H5DS57_9BACT|nr:UDP-N-acetylmuramoyl-L-alanyl-D-glutamate--2,6-diaminopimelate ligase [Estrella lausannensis]CRX39098.1 UDP-N-acetylmuramoyl-L-alanyl-D-glutamate--2,6-diaminopimelate ligase [Estrella lausannensis]